MVSGEEERKMRAGARGGALAGQTSAEKGICRWETPGVKQVRSGALRTGEGSFADKTRQVEEQGESVADDGRFVSVGETEEGGALEVAAGLGGIAGLGIALATEAQLPGVGVNRQVACQADLTAIGGVFGKCEADRSDIPQRMSRIVERANRAQRRIRGCGKLGEGDVRRGLVRALLAANPFGDLALVIVTVAGQAIAVGTERGAVIVETALQTSLWIVIALRMAQADRA